MLPTSPPASSIVTDNAAIRRHPFFAQLPACARRGKPRAIWSAADLPPLLRCKPRPIDESRSVRCSVAITGVDCSQAKRMPRPNLLSLFADFERHARDVAVVQRRGYRRESWTYARLAKIALICEQDLKQRGVRTGDCVLLWGPNSAEWMAAFWGCLLRGAVAVPIDDGAASDFATRVARETSPKLVFASSGKPALDSAIPTLNLEDLPDTPRHSHTVVATRVDPRQPLQPIFQSLSDGPITRSHVAQILFTSGTTAEPRGVVLTHGNFLATLEPLERGIDPYRKYERWFHPLRFVSLVPLSHVFGQFMTLLVPPLLGATVVFEPSANAADVLRTVKREGATALVAVPHMLELLRSGIARDLEARAETNWFRRTLAAAAGEKFLRRAWMFRRMHRRLGWKFWAFISGGAALAAESEDFFKRLGYAVVQGYGMTETASLISLNHPFRAAQGSIGKVLPGREFRLAEDGEILVRGENVASGYWQKGAIRQGVRDREDWLRTGDIGEVDAEGNLRFKGRKKNVIVTAAGLNIYPEDLEAGLRKQAGVRDCVVIASEHGGNAEPCAVLLMEHSFDAKDERARGAIQSANASLAEYQRMHRWLAWPEPDFPRTPTGKPRLNLIAACAAELLDGLSPAKGPVGALDDLVAKFSAGQGTSEKLEKELRLTSLDRVELMSALEERFQVELDETSFAEAKTVADVQRLLQQPAAHRTEHVYPRWGQRAPVRWLRLAVYYALVWPATQILGHPKIVGRENLRRSEEH